MSIYISRDGSVIFTVLFGTFLNLMYCMVVFYMSTGSPNKQGAESFRSLLIKHFFSIFFLLVFLDLVYFIPVLSVWMRVVWLPMWGERSSKIRDKN